MSGTFSHLVQGVGSSNFALILVKVTYTRRSTCTKMEYGGDQGLTFPVVWPRQERLEFGIVFTMEKGKSPKVVFGSVVFRNV